MTHEWPLSVELVITGCAFLLAAFILDFAITRHRERREAELWLDDMFKKHRQELRRRWKDGQFRPKSEWDKQS